MFHPRLLVVLFPLSLLVVQVGIAGAQDAPSTPPTTSPTTPPAAGASDDVKPWAKGVTTEARSTANKLFRAANSLLKDSLFVEAVSKYEAALGHWKHPAIHYNLALALMSLDQPINAYRHLESALVYGAAALGSDKLESGLRYKRLLERQIARVDITCDEPSAEIIVDGKLAFTGPGKHTSTVRIGEHSVVARKAGYVTQNQTKMLGPGDTLKLNVKMYTPQDMTRHRRKWVTWKPWAVVGGGAALLALGGTFHALARSGFNDYDAEIASQGGTIPDSSLQSTLDGAETKQVIAFVGYGLGAVAIAAGTYLVYQNRARPYRIDLEQQRRQAAPAGIASLKLAPTVSPQGLGMSAAFRF